MTLQFLNRIKHSQENIKKRFSLYRKASFLASVLLSLVGAIIIAHDAVSFGFTFVAFSGLSIYVSYFLCFLYECEANNTVKKSVQLSHVLSDEKNWEIIAKNSKVIK